MDGTVLIWWTGWNPQPGNTSHMRNTVPSLVRPTTSGGRGEKGQGGEDLGGGSLGSGFVIALDVMFTLDIRPQALQMLDIRLVIASFKNRHMRPLLCRINNGDPPLAFPPAKVHHHPTYRYKRAPTIREPPRGWDPAGCTCSSTRVFSMGYGPAGTFS